MSVAVGHHHRDDQSIAVGVVDEVCIILFESDVVVLPFKLLYRPFVHAVDIGKRFLLRLPDIVFLCPTGFFREMRSAEDRPDFAWEFDLKSIIMRPSPPVVDVMLEVSVTDEFLNLILEGDAFLGSVTNILVEPKVFVMVPLRAISMQRVKPLE